MHTMLLDRASIRSSWGGICRGTNAARCKPRALLSRWICWRQGRPTGRGRPGRRLAGGMGEAGAEAGPRDRGGRRQARSRGRGRPTPKPSGSDQGAHGPRPPSLSANRVRSASPFCRPKGSTQGIAVAAIRAEPAVARRAVPCWFGLFSWRRLQEEHQEPTTPTLKPDYPSRDSYKKKPATLKPDYPLRDSYKKLPATSTVKPDYPWCIERADAPRLPMV